MTLPRATLAVVLLMLWIGALSEQLLLWDEVVSWASPACSRLSLAPSVLSGLRAAAGACPRPDSHREQVRPTFPKRAPERPRVCHRYPAASGVRSDERLGGLEEARKRGYVGDPGFGAAARGRGDPA